VGEPKRVSGELGKDKKIKQTGGVGVMECSTFSDRSREREEQPDLDWTRESLPPSKKKRGWEER